VGRVGPRGSKDRLILSRGTFQGNAWIIAPATKAVGPILVRTRFLLTIPPTCMSEEISRVLGSGCIS